MLQKIAREIMSSVDYPRDIIAKVFILYAEIMWQHMSAVWSCKLLKDVRWDEVDSHGDEICNLNGCGRTALAEALMALLSGFRSVAFALFWYCSVSIPANMYFILQQIFNKLLLHLDLLGVLSCCLSVVSEWPFMVGWVCKKTCFSSKTKSYSPWP